MASILEKAYANKHNFQGKHVNVMNDRLPVVIMLGGDLCDIVGKLLHTTTKRNHCQTWAQLFKKFHLDQNDFDFRTLDWITVIRYKLFQMTKSRPVL